MTTDATGPLYGDAAIAAVRDYLARYRIPLLVVEDPKSPTAPITVTERLSGKSVRFSWGAIVEAEHAKNAETGSPYIRVTLDDGRRFAFAAVGIVFAPSFTSTGPVPDCPPTGCFQDFERLFRHLSHLSEDSHDEHHREALQVLMVLLAFLEGARLAGIDVTDEERDLEEILEKLEKGGAKL
ncbi:hypothetical protein L6R52_19965 [Myxococcota bacterium]|nr:hypothetical protein [Myxococcota bacterium]